MNVCECLAVPANLVPSQTAIVFGNRQLSYGELNALSISAAKRLVDCGVKPGDRVALMLPNAPSFPIWYYATLRIGAIAVSISTRLAPSEVEFIVCDCQTKVFVGSETAFESVQPSLPPCVKEAFSIDDATGHPTVNNQQIPLANHSETNAWYDAKPDAPALILYTSGTTGFPKGATLSHANVRSNVHAFNHLCNMQMEDCVLLAVPLFHCFGQNALLNSVLNVGGTIVLQQRFDLNESKQLISKHCVTQLYGVPMMFGLMLESCTLEDLASINYCFSAAATLPIQTSQRWQEKFGLPIHEGYGLTETSPFASYNHRFKFTPGSIGTPIDSVEIKIADTETGDRCPPGELGEIAIRGPNVMIGYWERPEETAAAIRDGWFHSGDIGRIDKNGFLYIVDRVKDMITVGGLKVFPAEVERVLLDHESVSQAAVVGVPDPVFGEQVIAYLVLNSDKNQQEQLAGIEQRAKANLGNYKVPRRLLVLEELPRNPSGKILKTHLRELASKQLAMTHDPARESSMEPIAEDLKPPTLRKRLANSFASEKGRIAVEFLQEQIRELCKLEKTPDPKDSFIEAGLDSLAIVELSAQLQLEIGAGQNLPPTLLFDYPRIIDLADFLVEAMSEEKMAPANAPNPVGESDAVQGRNDLLSKVEQMSEEEALAELMKELG